MVEAVLTREMKALPVFIEKPLIGTKAPRCVDGRESEDSQYGPQMLGGTIHVILLDAIYNDKDFNAETVSSDIQSLQSAGFKTGAHRGSHTHKGASDCSVADQLRKILQKAVDQRQEITRRLLDVIEANMDRLGALQNLPFEALINSAYDKIVNYSPDRIEIVGEDLVKKIEDSNSKVETVRGDHAEQIAFLNINPDTTLDTGSLNEQDKQAFNMDITEPVKQGQIFNIPPEFTIPFSAISYIATKMVLVEDKGKDVLPVEIHA